MLWGTLLQRRVPPAMLGRVSSLDFFVSLALMPVSMAIAGPVGETIGIATTFLIAGLVPPFSRSRRSRWRPAQDDEPRIRSTVIPTATVTGAEAAAGSEPPVDEEHPSRRAGPERHQPSRAERSEPEAGRSARRDGPALRRVDQRGRASG